ncbi:hypothetical protein ACFWWA_16940 [Streptomyces goshikiensis]|uniref:hypothetical protein n=1 Tax=Streptomyces goshikiensis TaxID=1942 RepID=UPI00365E5CA2
MTCSDLETCVKSVQPQPSLSGRVGSPTTLFFTTSLALSSYARDHRVEIVTNTGPGSTSAPPDSAEAESVFARASDRS